MKHPDRCNTLATRHIQINQRQIYARICVSLAQRFGKITRTDDIHLITELLQDVSHTITK